jgi:hypothetical protein
MLSTTIPAYLYEQYADDDDLQAFVDAYNQATQTLITWFATIGLPDYRGLTGPLLYWVAEGLYGLLPTSLASPASTAIGPPDTATPNQLTPNQFIPSTQTFYTLTEDFFKRILTWDFYKGDGKQFSIPWLKRRVMRFLLGVNGTDPQPNLPGFVIGTETTRAISVQFSGNTLTVTIYSVLLSSQAGVTAGVLSIFAAAFTGGYLDLPIQFNYACNIVAALTAYVTPTFFTLSGTATTQTTGVARVTTLAGSGDFTYAWSWSSGGSGITINSPSAANTSFTATGMTPGTTYSGIALCSITDVVTTQAVAVTVNVSITCTTLPPLLTGARSPLLTGSGGPILTG